MKKNNKTDKAIMYPEFGLDSRYKNKKEKYSSGKSLLEARLSRMNKLSQSQIINARLLQLKLQMEHYLKDSNNIDSNIFTAFLVKYIDTIYEKRAMFAKDINITPVNLSQVLNNHREPKSEFMYRLMLHSELVYKNICSFDKQTWYQIYYHQKISDTMANQKKWTSKERKHVKLKNTNLK